MGNKKFEWNEPSEKEIENSILEFLGYQIGCFAFKVNTMGVYDKQAGVYRKPSKYVIPGTPDIIACYSVKGIGVFVGLEVKDRVGRQSKEQKAFQEKIHDRADGFYFVVRSIEDVKKALETVKTHCSPPKQQTCWQEGCQKIAYQPCGFTSNEVCTTWVCDDHVHLHLDHPWHNYAGHPFVLY